MEAQEERIKQIEEEEKEANEQIGKMQAKVERLRNRRDMANEKTNWKEGNQDEDKKDAKRLQEQISQLLDDEEDTEIVNVLIQAALSSKRRRGAKDKEGFTNSRSNTHRN